MREGLAREFPEAVRAAAWTRGRVARRLELRGEPVAWATISAIGAAFLVSAVAQALSGLTVDAFQALRSPMPFTLGPLVTIAGISVAAAVALRVGGPLAFALYVGYIALGIALGIPGVMTFCERSGGDVENLLGANRCTVVGFLTSLWPYLIGIGLGVFFARAIATRGTGINSLLRIAGAYAIALFLLSHSWAYIAQDTNALTSTFTIAAGLVAAAVAAGVVAAQLPRGIRYALIVAAVSLLPWLTQLPLTLTNLGPTLTAEVVGPTLVTIAISPIAAAFLVLSAAVASRARFIPRDAA
jgi:hypothetical protein